MWHRGCAFLDVQEATWNFFKFIHCFSFLSLYYVHSHVSSLPWIQVLFHVFYILWARIKKGLYKRKTSINSALKLTTIRSYRTVITFYNSSACWITYFTSWKRSQQRYEIFIGFIISCTDSKIVLNSEDTWSRKTLYDCYESYSTLSYLGPGTRWSMTDQHQLSDRSNYK